MGKLAVDNKIKGQILGVYLLINTLNKCVDVSQTIGALAVLVDLIDERVEEFY